MPIPVPPPSGPPDVFLREIGLIVVLSGWLERALSDLYAVLLESRIGPLVAAGQSFEPLRQAANAVVNVVPDASDALKTDVRETLRRAKDTWDERNHVVHGNWQMQSHDDVERTVVRARQLRASNTRTFTLEDLRSLGARILMATSEIDVATQRWRDRAEIQLG